MRDHMRQPQRVPLCAAPCVHPRHSGPMSCLIDDECLVARARHPPGFHPRMVGLTGTVEQCAHAARQYRVYYSRAITDGTDEASDADEYLIDHRYASATYPLVVHPGNHFVRVCVRVCAPLY